MINDNWAEELARVKANVDRMVVEMGIEKAPVPKPVRQLDRTPSSTSFVAGALLRRGIRRELMSLADHGITFTEERGLLDSYFVVSGPRYKVRIFEEALRDYFRRLDA